MDEHDPRPLFSYAILAGTYTTLSSVAALAIRARRRKVTRFDALELVTYALATQHLSRLLAKDAVTSPLRAPFTRFVEAIGEGEVQEEVVGKGLRHAIGEMLTCPFSLSQWVATALVVGRALAPSCTTAVTSLAAAARLADAFQLAYDRARPS